jgi:hypothetical protein
MTFFARFSIAFGSRRDDGKPAPAVGLDEPLPGPEPAATTWINPVLVLDSDDGPDWLRVTLPPCVNFRVEGDDARRLRAARARLVPLVRVQARQVR